MPALLELSSIGIWTNALKDFYFLIDLGTWDPMAEDAVSMDIQRNHAEIIFKQVNYIGVIDFLSMRCSMGSAVGKMINHFLFIETYKHMIYVK